MNPETWTAVDDYFCERLLPPDPALSAVLDNRDIAGLLTHSVAPNQGMLLQLLAKIQGARKILEFGTMGGYSTIWLARALPADGRLISLESDPHHAAVARTNIARAGLADRVDIRVGKAIDTLPLIEAEAQGPFDLIFIDADKPSNPSYLEWSLKLSRPGTVIIADNVVRNGAVLDASGNDAKVEGIRRFIDLMAAEPRLLATAIQTVGCKGYDGFSVAVVAT